MCVCQVSLVCMLDSLWCVCVCLGVSVCARRAASKSQIAIYLVDFFGCSSCAVESSIYLPPPCAAHGEFSAAPARKAPSQNDCILPDSSTCLLAVRVPFPSQAWASQAQSLLHSGAKANAHPKQNMLPGASTCLSVVTERAVSWRASQILQNASYTKAQMAAQTMSSGSLLRSSRRTCVLTNQLRS